MAIDFPSSPTTGQTYTANNQTWTYNGVGWASGYQSSGYVRQQFTATAGQTNFTVNGGYQSGLVDVYQNGVKLVNGTDVTVTSGSNVVLATGASVGDTIEVIGLSSVSLLTYLPISGGTLGGALAGTDLTLSGTATAGILNAVTSIKVNGKKAVNGPAVSVFQSSSQSFSSGVATKVNLQGEDFDTDNAFDNTTNYRFTPQVEGYYQVSGRITVSASTSGTVMTTLLYKNGAAYKAGESYIPPSGSSAMTATLSSLVYLNGTTDYLEFWVNASGTGTITSSTGSANTYFSAVMVRGA